MELKPRGVRNTGAMLHQLSYEATLREPRHSCGFFFFVNPLVKEEIKEYETRGEDHAFVEKNLIRH